MTRPLSTRPQRPGISPPSEHLNGGTGAPEPPPLNKTRGQEHVTTQGTPTQTPDFEALKQKHTELSQRRQRLAYQLEQAQQEIIKCQEYAKTLGIETLEEFETQLKIWAEQDAKAFEQLQKDLLAEEQRQQKTEETLKSLQTPSG